MKLYHNHPETREYMGCTDAKKDPLETKSQGKDVFLVPAYATTIEPPAVEAGYARVFSSGAWTQIEDNRGKKVYNITDATELIVKELGAIPEGFTILVPCDYPQWDGIRWAVDQDAKNGAENAIIQVKLEKLDFKSIRSIREWIVKQSDAPVYLKEYDAQAETERNKLNSV